MLYIRYIIYLTYIIPITLDIINYFLSYTFITAQLCNDRIIVVLKLNDLTKLKLSQGVGISHSQQSGFTSL